MSKVIKYVTYYDLFKRLVGEMSIQLQTFTSTSKLKTFFLNFVQKLIFLFKIQRWKLLNFHSVFFWMAVKHLFMWRDPIIFRSWQLMSIWQIPNVLLALEMQRMNRLSLDVIFSFQRLIFAFISWKQMLLWTFNKKIRYHFVLYYIFLTTNNLINERCLFQ